MDGVTSTYIIDFTCAGIKTVVKQPDDKIVAGMLANKAPTCIGTRPQANTSLINQPQNNS